MTEMVTDMMQEALYSDIEDVSTAFDHITGNRSGGQYFSDSYINSGTDPYLCT